MDSIISYKKRIIKYNANSIIFRNSKYVFKQYALNKYKWLNEVSIVNYLDHPHIIKFTKCSVIDDHPFNHVTRELYVSEKSPMMRIQMPRYKGNLSKITLFSDDNIFHIINAILSALLYCNSHNVLHRDVKEQNILINYTNKNKLIITDIVLADFDTSKYKYNVITSECGVITVSHRPPELNRAITDNIPIVYDNRVDVWSFCILLTFLLTGKSLYSFILHNYIDITEILTNTSKYRKTIFHFINLHKNIKLRHFEFYKKILKMGLVKYSDRPSFDDIHEIFISYASIYGYTPYTQKYRMPCSPEQRLSRLSANWLVKYHQLLNNDDVVYVLTLKFINTCKNIYIIQLTNIHKVSIYIMISIIIHNNMSLDNYLQVANYCLKSVTGESLESTELQKNIIYLMSICQNNILETANMCYFLE
jgi:serine/threonine protein kinase